MSKSTLALTKVEEREERKVGGVRYEKLLLWGAHLPIFWLLSLQNVQTIEPNTAWTAVSSRSASTMYSFLDSSGLGRALWANSGEDSAQ